MASAINTLQQSTEPTARRWLWVLFPVNHLFVFCLENPGGWAAIKSSADILHYGDETQRIVEAIADTIFALRGSSECFAQLESKRLFFYPPPSQPLSFNLCTKKPCGFSPQGFPSSLKLYTKSSDLIMQVPF